MATKANKTGGTAGISLSGHWNQINVKIYKGVVQLSVFVDSQQSIKRVEEVAGSVSGVVSVENDLNVK